MNKEDENIERNGNNVTQQFAMIWNYNAHIEHQHNYYGEQPMEAKEDAVIPDQLKSNRAKGMMSIAVECGILDDNWQPRTGVEEWKLACIANKIGEELNLSNKWSVFAQLWSRKPDNLRGLYNRYKDTDNERIFRKNVLNKIH